ncbi:Tlg2-vesicle protein [Dimargaris xerosporica]|nr:Tlg2-vesicle protein [Dimargaris xerosporica]
MLTTLAGFAYGFPLGFIPCFVGALGGSVACFTLCRRYGQHHLQWLYNWNPHTTAAVRAIEKKGFKLLLLIRLSPYPFNLVNALLSGTQIPVRQFALATALSLIKLNMHVYIGANLTEFSNAMFEQKSPWQIAIMVVGMVVGTGVMVYIYWLTKRAVDVVADIPPEGEEVPMQWISDAASEQVLEVHEEPPVHHSLDEHPLQNSKARRVPSTITNSSWDWDGSEDDDSQP